MLIDRTEYGVEVVAYMTEADNAKITVWVKTAGYDVSKGPEHVTGCLDKVRTGQRTDRSDS